MERELPMIKIEGTAFIIDVNKVELRQKDNETNVIPFSNMHDIGNGYIFEYDLQEKNIPFAWSDNEKTTIRVPDLVVLDPVGMAKKYNIPLEEIWSKTDFELMVDQGAFYRRVTMEFLPTIQIEGHPFFVDLQMDTLRPKDNFLSNGIAFSDIEDFFDPKKGTYTIPYNPEKKELGQINYETITKLPKDLVVVEIPSELKMDPIGWNRKHGFDIKKGLKEMGLQMAFKAKPAQWEDIYVPQKIKQNLEREKQQLEPNVKKAMGAKCS